MRYRRMSIRNALAGIAVKDFRSALSWYEQLLGRAATRPMAEVAEFEFENGGWLQVFADAQRAGFSSVTLTVTDLDEQLHDLRSKSLEASSITNSSLVKTATVTDPDGNQIVFAQPLSERIAQ